ncbi:hypothetical protein DFA_04720 [Cavenderia fasciculata]|uniref:Sulfhydryl oxidase n=1 Tax=Cavenderia fasciculata TaxID=261658 RepID=F4PQC7_CACFS|nr:uncharacterized protein DFA_04720 [Cavenderia fasciculata]EGG22590.1 hypothetical protein DFA_04720 [Cavenderia fasciculata]|eukprot:XP_004360441.1 hypothetical protein DFA_04720 [Cavenderia fasciculata]
MGLSDRVKSVQQHQQQQQQQHSTHDEHHTTNTNDIIIPLSKNDHVNKEQQEEEDCDVCTVLGVSDKKKQMFDIISGGMGMFNGKGISEDSSFWEPMGEPLDLIDLGHSGWNMLHTMAAYYPDKPTDTKKKEMTEFLHSFSKVYPCKDCAQDFQGILRDTPPKLDNQKEFSKWMCDSHNHVNNLLGKPLFDCNLVDKRWKRNITPH